MPYDYNRPTKLDLQVQDIENEYKDRKWSVKHDENLSRQEKKATVLALNAEKEKAIREARLNYYKKQELK